MYTEPWRGLFEELRVRAHGQCDVGLGPEPVVGEDGAAPPFRYASIFDHAGSLLQKDRRERKVDWANVAATAVHNRRAALH